MGAPRDLSHLPVELLSHCFDFLSPSQMDVTKQVCAVWRAVTFDHPTYWGEVVVDGLDRGVLALARAQFTAAHGRSCNLTINIRSAKNPRIVWLLYMIEDALACLRELRVTMDVSYVSGLLDALGQPAPLLEYFELKAYGRGLPYEFAPRPNLFGGLAAPRLRKIVLLNVFFPQTPVPAFRSVTDITLDYRISAWSSTQTWRNGKVIPFPSQVFSSCPDLTRLSICGATATITIPSVVPPHVRNGLSNLSFLSLHAEKAHFEHLISLPSCSRVENMILSPVDKAAIEQAAEHLDGDLHVDIGTTLSEVATKQVLQITLSQNLDFQPIRRTFLLPPCDRSASGQDLDGDTDRPTLAALFTSALVAPRLRSLRIDPSAWDEAVATIPADNSIATLTVSRTTVREFESSSEMPLFPSLETINILESDGYRTLHSAVFLKFLSHTTRNKVHLQLDGVMLKSCSIDMNARLLSVRLV